MRLVRIVAATAVLLASSALAAPARKGEAGWDPNREICKSRPVVGSRLKRVRECHTAQQWEDMELQERVGLMRKQFNGDPSNAPVTGGGRDSPW